MTEQPIRDERALENLTLDQLVQLMIRIQGIRRRRVRELRELRVALAAKIRDQEVAHAGAFLGADGAMDLRKQEAVLAAAEAKFQTAVAEAEVESCRESIKILIDDWDTCRTASANKRSEMAMSGMAS